MADDDTPPVPAEEANMSGRAAAPERGVQLDVDKMISSLMSYKNDPGKQVRMCFSFRRFCSCSVVCFMRSFYRHGTLRKCVDKAF